MVSKRIKFLGNLAERGGGNGLTDLRFSLVLLVTFGLVFVLFYTFFHSLVLFIQQRSFINIETAVVTS